MQIRVVDSHKVDGSDLSFLEGAVGSVALPRGRRAAETGFKNMLLFGGGGGVFRPVTDRAADVEEDGGNDGSYTIL